MAAIKMALNGAKIANLPEGTYADTRQRGLILKVTAKSKRFSLYCWLNGRPTKRAIGIWPEMDVPEARRQAAAMVGGASVVKETFTTLDELVTIYTAYLEDCERRTSGYARRDVELSWKHLLDRNIETITTAELAAEHSKILRKRGPMAANRSITTLRTLFNYAGTLDLMDKNPAKKVRLVPEKSRETVLSPYEETVLRKVLDGMYHPTDDIRDYFLLALTTGLRRSNICALRWSWWKEGCITIPAEASKNGEAFTIPCCPEAEDILIRRQKVTTSEEFVFPSAKSHRGHLTEPWYWLKEVRSRMAELGVDKGWHIHDLRRTYASELTERGAPLTIVAKALGHRNVNTTPVYARTREGIESIRKYQ